MKTAAYDEIDLFDAVTRKLFGRPINHDDCLALDELLGCHEYRKWVDCREREEVPMCASCRQKLEKLKGPYGEVFHKMMLLEKADDNG